MTTATRQRSARRSWEERAGETLRRAGHRRGGARAAVIAALARHDCAVTALELEEELRDRRAGVGRASVYRALEQLERLGLVQRVEAGHGTAGFERVDPGGHHHHHAICRDCGRMVPFEDPTLERALEEVAGTMSFDVTEHDVVLRGHCDRCAR